MYVFHFVTPWDISIRILRMHLIFAIMNFNWSHAIALQKLSNERSYKIRWILTLTEVISIRILRLRIISTIMNFYWSHAIPLQKLSNEHSYKFSLIFDSNRSCKHFEYFMVLSLLPFKNCPMNVLISLAEL